MWRYLKSAFLVRVNTPGLGELPVNALAASAFGILGFVQPAFWLLGLAVQAVVVPSLAFNPRFQNYVQAQQLQTAKEDHEAERKALVTVLDERSRYRLNNLGSKCARILDIFHTQGAEDYVIDSNREALSKLQWVYTKLLVARHHLLSPADDETEDTLQTKIATIDRQLENSPGPDSLRESRLATQTILKKRLENFHRREQTLAEVESDLTRVEAQVDLLIENATMQAKPETISTDIELASDLLGAGVFGDDESAISAIDRKYSAQKPPLKETAG